MARHSILTLLGIALAAPVAGAKIQSTPVEYTDGDTTLAGELVFDDARPGKVPGVVVVHQWMGVTDHERGMATRLAELGYVAFVADVYGKDERPKDMGEAGKKAGFFKSHPDDFRRRVQLALAELRRSDRVDAARTAAIGFCFGGTGVLELARSGADVLAVVSFHGGLATPAPAVKGAVKAHVLALHGAADPHVPPAEVQAFEKEMTDAGVDWSLTAYGHAVHAFTQKEAGNDPSRGVAYDEHAARRSFTQMAAFLAEVFGG